MELYLFTWKKIRNLNRLLTAIWFGWLPFGLFGMMLLRYFVPWVHEIAAGLILLVFWTILNWYFGYKLASIRCPRCNNMFFQGRIFDSSRSNCSHCGLRYGDTETNSEGCIVDPVAEFDPSMKQFTSVRLFGIPFILMGGYCFLKGLLSFIYPELTIPFNGKISNSAIDKVIVVSTSFVFLANGIVCTFYARQCAKLIHNLFTRFSSILPNKPPS